MQRELQIPDSYAANFSDAFDIASFSQEDTWNKFHNVFNKDNTGNCGSASFLSRYNATSDTYDFFVSHV